MRTRLGISMALAITLTAGAALVAVPASASRAEATIDFTDYDQATVDALIAQGFSQGEALFIALTKVEAKTISDDHVRLTNSFPTGNTAVIDVRIAPKSAGDPDALTVKHAAPGGDLKFSLGYFVAADSIPTADQPSALGGGVPGAVASLASFPAAAPTGDKPSGFQVLVQGLVDSIKGEKADNFLKEMDKKLKVPQLDRINNGMKVAQTVGDVMAMGIDLAELEKELDEIEKCAKNPSNPLGRKNNKENPEDLQRVLNEIAATRAELRGNTAVMVVGTINSTASGFIQGAPGWLGHVIGPGTSWAIDTLKKIAVERINELRKQAKCKNDLKVDAVMGGLWTFTGIKCNGPVGKWVLDGTMTGAPGGTGTQTLSFTLAGASLSGPSQSTGSISAAGQTRSFNESGNAKFNESVENGGGTLNFGGQTLPVTAGKFCTEVSG